MNKTGFLFDRRYLLHKTGSYHPEVPERLEMIYKGIEEGGLLSRLVEISASKADMKWIETVHAKAYIDQFEEVCRSGQTIFNTPDNQMCAQSFETALLAVGGILDTVNLVMEGQIDNAFCAVRPPGHHAERNEALGFCYFNNIAIAARYLQMKWGVEKVAIVDFDVHHGNGTQHIFESDPTVFYSSIHEHPSFAFPGTGRVFEKGSGPGEGYTVNYPVLPGQGDAEYRQFFETVLTPAMDEFNPGFILVSTGFDAHVDDDMSGASLTTGGYSWVMERLVQMAATYAKGRLISVLEGGYCLRRLPELAKNHVEILLHASKTRGPHVRQ